MFNAQQRPAAPPPPSQPAATPAWGQQPAATPAWGQQPTQPAAQQPAAAPAPERKVWAVINGAPQLIPLSQAATLPITTPAQDEGQTTGWVTLAAFLPAPAAAQPAAPAGPAWGQQAAQPAPAQPTAPAAWGQQAAQPAANTYRPAAQPQQPQGGFQGGGQQNGIAPAGLFAGIENAQVFGNRGDRLTDGNYIGRYVGATYHAGRTKNHVFLEVEILQSTYEVSDPNTHGCKKVGDRVSICLSLNDSFKSNFKEVVLAISGFDAQGNPRPETAQVSEAECNEIIGPPQRYSGKLVYLEARTRPQRNKPNENFTYINWWAMPVNPDGSPDLVKFNATR